MNVRRLRTSFFLFLLFLLSSRQSDGQVRPVSSVPSPLSSPTFFIANKGQWPSDVRYLAQLAGMEAWVNDRGIVYDFYRIVPKPTGVKLTSETTPSDEFHPSEPEERVGHIIGMEFVGGTGRAVAVEETKRGAYYNYFIGDESANWASHVPLYDGVKLEGIYPGIDAALHFDGGALRYDLHVEAGAEPNRIGMKFTGAEGVHINGSGELVLETSLGEVVHGSLLAYQEIGGERREVACRFIRRGEGEIGFGLGEYDRNYPLVIDPLVYSTYLGGADFCRTGLHASGVDADGNFYITGTSLQGSYPTTHGAYDRTGTNGDIVVSELDATGTELIFSTFVGGNGAESGEGLALDGEGNVYLAGITRAVDGMNTFPLSLTAYDKTPSQSGDADFVVVKLSDSGTHLAYSTFLGGTADEAGGSIDIDKLGNAYVTGVTSSRDYPVTTNGFKRLLSDVGTAYDALVTKLNPTGSALVYSTYLGGSNYEWGYDIVVDRDGYAYVTGATGSADFPSTPGVYSRALSGNSSGLYDVFVTKVDTTGSGLVYSTFLGGTQSDEGRGIAIDSSGNVYVVGETHSTNFPITLNAYARQLSGTSDGFVAKFNTAGSGLYYSTLLGGEEDDALYGVAVYRSGNAVVTGVSQNEGYPTTHDAFDRTSSGGGEGRNSDIVVTKLDVSGSSLLYSTYLGDVGKEYPEGVVLSSLGDVYVGGSTTSPYFPLTPGAYDRSSPSVPYSSYKMFAVRLELPCTMSLRSSPDADICSGSFAQLSAEAVDGIGPYTYSWQPAAGLSSAKVRNPIASPSTSTRYILTVTDAADCVALDTVYVNVFTPPVAHAGADTTICAGEEVRIGGEGSGSETEGTLTYIWEPTAGLSDPKAANPLAQPKVTTRYVVTVTDEGGCQTRDTVEIKVLAPIIISAGSNVEICPGRSAVIGGGATGGLPPYRYQWEPSLGLSRSDTSRPTASPTATTVYRVRVTDARGCTVASDSIRVTVLPIPKPVITIQGSAALCAGSGDSVTLDAGEGYQRYQWSNGEESRTIRVGSAGRYSVVVTTAEGCSGESDTVDVPVFSPPDVTIDGPAIICSSTQGIYSATDAPNTEYAWRLESLSGTIISGARNSIIAVRWGGPEIALLHLTVRNLLTGCVDSATYQVIIGDELKPLITGSHTICPGGNVELDAGGGYAWYTWSTGETTRTIRVDHTSIVTVKVTDAGGCGGTSDPFIVTAKPKLDVRLSSGGEIRLCPGGEEEINAPSGYVDYRWSNGERGESIRVSDEGEYWVEVTDADGCIGISDTARVTHIEEEVRLSPGGTLHICEGDSVALNGPSGYSEYEWSTGERSRMIWVKLPGRYWVKVQGSGGCELTSDTADAITIPVPPQPEITQDGNTLRSSSAETYQWLRNGVEIIGERGESYVAAESGEYQVRVENSEGCSSLSESVTISRSQKEYKVSLNKVSGRVGERLRLRMSVTPALSSSDAVTGYRAWLHIPPDAIFIHQALSSGNALLATPLTLVVDKWGGVFVECGAGGAIVTGDILFELDFEGLVSGQPTNEVVIDSLELIGAGNAVPKENGIVLLTGCELGRGFVKGAKIVSVAPNPGVEGVEVRYQIPEGMRMQLRIVDMSGQTLRSEALNAGSGAEEGKIVDLQGLSGGVYILELRDGEEVTTAPLIIRR